MVSWYRSAEVAFEALGASVYLLDVGNLDRSLGPRALQGPAAQIWLLLGSFEAPRNEQEIIEALAADFGVDAGTVRAETVEFLEHLETSGLASRT